MGGVRFERRTAAHRAQSEQDDHIDLARVLRTRLSAQPSEFKTQLRQKSLTFLNVECSQCSLQYLKVIVLVCANPSERHDRYLT